MSKREKRINTNMFEIKKKKEINILKLITNNYLLIVVLIFVIANLFLKNFGISLIISVLVLLIYLSQYILNKKYYINKCCNKVKILEKNELSLIDLKDLKINDILYLEKGDLINIKGIITKCSGLVIDETSLNGNNSETKTINNKNNKDELKSNYVYPNTYVKKGTGYVKVININNINNTNYKILNFYKNKIKNIEKLTNIIYIILSILMFIMLNIKYNFLYSISFVLMLSLIFIPKEIKYSINLLYKIKCKNINKKNVIIKDMSVIKKLNDTNFLVFEDNILTNNEYEICDIISDNVEELFVGAINSSNLSYNELLNLAIIDYCKKLNIVKNENKIIKKYLFKNNINMCGNLYKDNNLYMSGEVSSIVDICNLSIEDKFMLYAKEEELNSTGLEVIAVCSKQIDEIHDDIYEYKLDYKGLIGYKKPIKHNVVNNILDIKNLNINMIIFTNNKELIIKNILKKIKLNNYKKIINKEDIQKLDDDELLNLIKNGSIINNVSKKEKKRILNILNNNYKVCSIDNYNDDLNLNICSESNLEITKDKSDIIMNDDILKNSVNLIVDSKYLYKYFNDYFKYSIIFDLVLFIIFIIMFWFNILTTYLIIIVLILKIIKNYVYIKKRKKENFYGK